MKIRQGFVSNSSSSSFICLISGHVEAGMDMSLSDAGMVECENDHVFLDDYVVGKIPPTNIDGDEYDYHEEWRYECPAANCPVCTMSKIPDDLLLKYILKSRDLKKSEILQDIQTSFNEFKQFKEFVS